MLTKLKIYSQNVRFSSHTYDVDDACDIHKCKERRNKQKNICTTSFRQARLNECLTLSRSHCSVHCVIYRSNFVLDLMRNSHSGTTLFYAILQSVHTFLEDNNKKEMFKVSDTFFLILFVHPSIVCTSFVFWFSAVHFRCIIFSVSFIHSVLFFNCLHVYSF